VGDEQQVPVVARAGGADDVVTVDVNGTRAVGHDRYAREPREVAQIVGGRVLGPQRPLGKPCGEPQRSGRGQHRDLDKWAGKCVQPEDGLDGGDPASDHDEPDHVTSLARAPSTRIREKRTSIAGLPHSIPVLRADGAGAPRT
jgi:hypothetical protein